MAKALNDFRVQIPESVDLVLEAEAIGMGEDKQTIARQVLEKWAKQRHRAFKVYARRLRANGLQLELDGLETEDDGASRSQRK